MKLKKYLLVFVIMGMMLSAIPITANHASAAGTYDYKVSSSQVLNSAGSVVYTGTSFTTALNWALSNVNKVTYVPAGTYTLAANVYFGQGTTLFGDGDSTVFTSTSSHDLYINGVSSVTMKSFMFTGHLQIYGYKAGGTSTSWTFNAVHATTLTGDMEAAFWMYVGANGIIDGITFTDCSATYSQTYGFLLFGDDNSYTGNSQIKDVTFTGCTASHNGNDNIGWVNAWITGYDLVECTTVSNIVLNACVADYNWCSGFHFEYGATPKGIYLIDCSASYNGQKPNCEQYYGYGFRFQSFQVPGISCINCKGTGNDQGLSMVTSSSATVLNCGSTSAPGGTTTVPPAPASVPGTVTGVTATASNGAIALAWTTPSNSGSAVSQYKIYRSTVSGSETLLTTVGAVNSYTNTGLTNGATYYYKVAAVNSVGTGALSAEAHAVPQATSVPPTTGTVPGAVTGVTATASNAAVTLKWTAPSSGTAITGYKIYRSWSAGTETLVATLGPVSSYTNTWLTNGVTYYFKVAAVNAAGTGALSTDVHAAPHA
jgi:hypothetical protein